MMTALQADRIEYDLLGQAIRSIEEQLKIARPYCRAIVHGKAKTVRLPCKRSKRTWHGVKAVVESDPVAQAVRSHRSWLLRLAGSEDVLQDAVVQVLKHGAQDKAEAVRLIACACKRQALNDARSQARAVKRLADVALLSVPRHDPQCRAVRDAVQCLSKADRQLVQAIYWDDMSITEYAQTVGQTRAAVSMRLSRVRDRLAVILSE